jgi:hypothetical protein
MNGHQTRWTRSECFEYFDVTPRNPRWSWSARSADGSTVALVFWEDELREENGKYTYELPVGRTSEQWMRRAGSRERLENLKWAQDYCGGLVRVVMATAEDPTADPRKIAHCSPEPSLVMQITYLDVGSGAFRVEGTKTDKRK